MLVSRPPRAAWVILLAALLTAGPATVMAVPQTFDFEGLAAGTVIAGLRPNGFIATSPYAGVQMTAQTSLGLGTIEIFDTAHPTGDDFDLGTPNQGFGGPGVGIGGQPGMPGQNNVAYKKIAIIAENIVDVNGDGRVDVPDDNADGGSMTFQWDVPGLLQSAVVIDIEETGGSIDQYLGNQLVQSFPIPALGNNSRVVVNTMTRSLIDRTVINLAGSGGLAQLTYDFFVVPTEASTWSRIKSMYGR